jgi:hypothetical protein
MTKTLTRAWREPAPTRDGLAQLGPLDAELWASRLLADRERATRHQTAQTAAITAAVESRSRQLGAAALVLTGSTARGRRTAVSDLDCHVIGTRPRVEDLPAEVDLYCDEPAEFLAKLERGDPVAATTCSASPRSTATFPKTRSRSVSRRLAPPRPPPTSARTRRAGSPPRAAERIQRRR